MDGEKGVFFGAGVVVGGTAILVSVSQTSAVSALDWAAALGGPLAALAALAAAMASIAYQRSQAAREHERQAVYARRECAPMLYDFAHETYLVASRLADELVGAANIQPTKNQLTALQEIMSGHLGWRVRFTKGMDQLGDTWFNRRWAFTHETRYYFDRLWVFRQNPAHLARFEGQFESLRELPESEIDGSEVRSSIVGGAHACLHAMQESYILLNTLAIDGGGRKASDSPALGPLISDLEKRLLQPDMRV